MPDTQIIPGAVGELELLVEAFDDENGKPARAIAVCCHPHPLHGGTMLNKVVHIVAKTMSELGCHVVRFNFRGVGRSEGDFAEGIGERDDLMAVVNWSREQWPGLPIWLSGFSFGAYVAAASHERVDPQRLVLVAPPVDMYPEIKNIQIQTKDWVLIQGEQDEIVDAMSVNVWSQQQVNKAKELFFTDASHFFHGKLNLIKEGLLDAFGEETK